LESRNVSLPGAQLEVEVVLARDGLTATGSRARTAKQLPEAECPGDQAITQRHTPAHGRTMKTGPMARQEPLAVFLSGHLSRTIPEAGRRRLPHHAAHNGGSAMITLYDYLPSQNAYN